MHRHVLFAHVAAAFPGVFAGQVLNFYISELALILCFALILLGMVIIIYFENSGSIKGILILSSTINGTIFKLYLLLPAAF